MIRAYRDAVRMEVVRVRTVRASFVVVLTAVGAGAVLALLLGLLSPPGVTMTGEDTTTALTAGGDGVPLSVIGVFLGVLGVITVAHDYRYRLVRAVLIAQPRRGVLVAARLTVLGVIAAAAATVASLLGAGLCLVFGRHPLLDGTTARILLVQAGVTAGWAWLGAALGWLLRNAAGALAVLLLTPLFVEPMLTLLVHFEVLTALRPAVPWLPFATAREALGRSTAAEGLVPGAITAAGAFFLITVVTAVLAWVVVERRDA